MAKHRTHSIEFKRQVVLRMYLRPFAETLRAARRKPRCFF
jgi:hypothetical protein